MDKFTIWTFGVLVGFVAMFLLCIVQPSRTLAPVQTHASAKDIHLIVATTGYHCPAGKRSRQCDQDIDDGRTATNRIVNRGICAADFRVFPPGTMFEIPHYGFCIVEDRGRLIQFDAEPVGLKLDLYFTNNQEAVSWGRKLVRARLVRWGRNSLTMPSLLPSQPSHRLAS